MGKPERTIRIPKLFKILFFFAGFLGGLYFHELIIDVFRTASGTGLASIKSTIVSALDFAKTNPIGLGVGFAIFVGILWTLTKFMVVFWGFIVGLFTNIALKYHLGIQLPDLPSLFHGITPF